jgi:hypothetical protein
MPRLTADQWAAIRIAWEGDPAATYESAAAEAATKSRFDPPVKSSVSERARKEEWSKRNQLAAINESASRRADSATEPNGEPIEPNETTAPFGIAVLASREESEIKRAAVLVRHRAEWAALEMYRRHALAAMDAAAEAGQRDEWLIAKTAADTAKANFQALQVKQDGERKAWNLDDNSLKIDISKASDAELEAMVKGGK